MLSFLAFSLLSLSFAQEKSQIKTFSPQGTVRTVEQVRVEFAKPQVKFGDLNLTPPAQSSCFKDGQGRWIDTKNWVFDFKTPIKGGQSCAVKIQGETFSFNTGGPHVTNVFPMTYQPIDSDQNFILMLDASFKKESAKGIYFTMEGLGDEIPAMIIEGSEATEILEAAKKQYQYEKESFKGIPVVLRATRNFPPSAKVVLVWSKEVESLSGMKSKEDETFEFTVQEDFKAQFNCVREGEGKPCVPLSNMQVSLTSPIQVKDIKRSYLEMKDGKKIKPNLNDADVDQDWKSYFEFKGPFPEKAQMKLFIPTDVKDDGGRSLANKAQFPLSIKTGDNPALLKFSANFGVVEAEPNAAVAVTVRRVEKNLQTKFIGITGEWKASNFKEIINALTSIDREPYGDKPFASWGTTPQQKIVVTKPLSSAETEVVGVPLKQSGFYVLEMASPLLGQSLLDRKANYYVRTAALVTKMAVHVKYNQNQAWALVTDLKSASPIASANVNLYDIRGARLGSATTDKNGFAKVTLSKEVEKLPRIENQYGPYSSGFFVVAEKGDDFTFTHSDWNRGIESWRYQMSYRSTEPTIGHAILDRSLLKPEETLAAKLILRDLDEKGLSIPKAKDWPSTLVVMHDSGLQTFKVPVQWDRRSGTAAIKWNIPAGAKLGRWVLQLERKNPDMTLEVGDVRIENFRVPLMQVQVQGSPTPFVLQSDIPVHVTGNYFSGGPATELPLKVRWSVEPSYFSVQDDDLQEYAFANGAVKEGLFRSGEEETGRHVPQSGVKELKLDKTGSGKTELEKIKYSSAPQRLRVEAEYKDPNGEIQSAVRSFDLWSSNVIVGIKAKSWSATKDKVEFKVAALDLQQRPLKNQAVSVDLYTSRYFSHRKRLVGGFYSYDSFEEVKKVGSLCQGVTDNKGEFNCSGKTSFAGSVVAVASTKDSQGRISQANTRQWIVSSEEQQWFGPDDNDRADLIPFKKHYEPGETAEFQLRTPFPEAKVLVTVERESVLYSEVIDVKGSNPTIRIPIKPEYAPNVVVSAFAIRGRLGEPKPTALVDLGKPAFKLGLSEIKVGWKHNTLKVAVKTDKKVFSARQTAKVDINVTDFNGKPAHNGEVVIAAVDEGLLELRDNKTWDVLTAMMQMHPYLIRTATAQSMVIGKRHFGLKALPIGGDGGRGLRRELFDTLLYWNPSVKLDKNGHAQVEVKLNDSTTSFRIVAVALQNADQFGTGWTSIQSTQDLMIMPGLAAVTRQGDKFNAGFTVRNTTAKAKDVVLTLNTTPAQVGLAPKKIHLEANSSQEVFWKVAAGSEAEIQYVMTAKEADGKFLDEIKKTQKVLPVRQPRVYQSEFGQWPSLKEIALKQAAGAEPGSSSVIVEASASIGSNDSGIKDFWKNYQYNCLEQQISRAVSLNDKNMWKKIEARLSTYMDGQGLLTYFPSGTYGSVALTSYVLSIANEAGFELSDENEQKLLGALSAYSEGRLKEAFTSGRVDEVLKKISAFEALSRYRRLNIDLLSTINFQGTQWPLATLVEWYEIHLWEKSIPGRTQKIAELESILRNKFYFTGRRMLIREEGADNMPWMMRDADSALLRLIDTVANEPSWKNDVPRMMQGSIARQHGGSWMLTNANAWGRLAMNKFDQTFQGEKVSGNFKATLAGSSKEASWAKGPITLELPWKDQESKLAVQQIGTGKPWITASAKAAIPATKAVFAGFNVEKTVEAVEQKKKGQWSVGDTAKVTLKIKSPAVQSWVVIEDPIPAGSTILTSSYATAVERKSELIRFYQEWFEQGEQKLEYTVRFNQAGEYQLPVTRVEAMYSPDVFAELPEGQWQVAE
ncbi:alpha-2-macroglobulin [Bdellovibrio sp. NC01]|uniref:alpha-2-macroglobulin family protein n=1 Tax=Bdellovibrio sp. NC01 TaxID=2220073 RepID=UPI001159A54C|nr:MG2 domain-containing protein [Bdellovibrio sp. NC01]QDK36338.1 hypothetical protein DOE51_01335 [Bdellovibrio sp. NC01]